MDFVCVCVRIPKSGSTSLDNSLKAAFAGRHNFYLPHSVNLEGPISAIQALRFHRTRARNLLRHYGTSDLITVYDFIRTWALEGDLIHGGHIDFPSVRDNIKRNLKMIAMFRDPAERCRSEYRYCRQVHLRKPAMSRLDATIMHKTAGMHDFDSHLDFLLDHAEVYGNLAARYIGWDGKENLAELFARDVFHSGVLEKSALFARGLAEKMGTAVSFPHDNRTGQGKAANFTAAQRRKIERLYGLDYALYEWQLAHLDESAPRGKPVFVDASASARVYRGLGLVA